jgi:hypothetical protein
MLEHDLRNEAAGLQVTAALQLEEITLRADHRPTRQALQQISHDHSFVDGSLMVGQRSATAKASMTLPRGARRVSRCARALDAARSNKLVQLGMP